MIHNNNCVQDSNCICPKFAIGDQVRKVSGYKYYGEIVALFKTTAGKLRVVVEQAGSEGMLHIFSTEQIEIVV